MNSNATAAVFIILFLSDTAVTLLWLCTCVCYFVNGIQICTRYVSEGIMRIEST